MRPAPELLLQGFSVLINIVFTHGNDIGYFWQLNDLHLDLNYSNHPRCQGRFGNYQCDSPLDLVVSAINATQQLIRPDQRPDFVIWAGDNGPHAKWGHTFQIVKDSLRNVSHHMRRVFSPTPDPQNHIYVLPVLGNHDVFPFDTMSLDPADSARRTWCHRLGSDPLLWGSWIASDQRNIPGTARIRSPPSVNYSTGCFFSHLMPESRLLLVALNGLIWYANNPLCNESVADPLGQFRWLNDSLIWARSNGFKVLIVSHFPPGASENGPQNYRFLKPSFNKQFVDLLVRHADHIMAGLFAHTHVDSFRVVSDLNDRPVLSLFISPSVTPMRQPTLGSFNPRIRLYRYNRTAGLLLGYSQYVFNLSAAPTTNPTWTLEYDTQGPEYRLTDLSPRSLRALLDEFAVDDGRADGPWAAYWRYELGGLPHEPNPDLTPDGQCPQPHSHCRCQHLCPMRRVDLTRMDNCLSSCPLPTPTAAVTAANESTGKSTADSDQSSSLPIIIGVIVAFLFILIGVVLIVNRETCRHRRLRGRRPLFGAVRDGDVVFSSPNGDVPPPFSNGSPGVPVEFDQFSEGGSSSTELRTAFHPKYITDDVPHPLAAPGNRSHAVLYVSKGLGGFAATYGQHELMQRATDSPTALFSPRARPTGYHRPAVPTNNPTPNGMLANGGEPLNPKPAPSSMPYATEDYYADDEEAFGDDEDGGLDDMMVPGCDSSVSTSEIDSPVDANHSFSLDQGHVPLTQSRPGRKPRRLSNKRQQQQLPFFKDGSVQSIKDHSAVNGRPSVPPLRHSQSAMMGGSPSDESPTAVHDLLPSSYSAAVHSSPYHGIPCSLANGHPEDLISSSSSTAGRLPNGDPMGGYMYVRI